MNYGGTGRVPIGSVGPFKGQQQQQPKRPKPQPAHNGRHRAFCCGTEPGRRATVLAPATY